MVAEISHFLKGTINFLVKFRIIEKIRKKLIFQGMKAHHISSKRNCLRTGNSVNDASAEKLYRMLSLIRSRTATQRPAWPQDGHLRSSSAAAPQGGEGPAVWLPHGVGGTGGNWVKEERSSVWTTLLQP